MSPAAFLSIAYLFQGPKSHFAVRGDADNYLAQPAHPTHWPGPWSLTEYTHEGSMYGAAHCCIFASSLLNSEIVKMAKIACQDPLHWRILS